MATSQNGYPANNRGCVSQRSVPGTSTRLAVRNGPAGDVLIAAAARWHREVEPLVEPGNWGYAERTIRGSSTQLSNHASGTAIDLNAPRHPLGTQPSANFSPRQISAIRRIVSDFSPALRWGGDYVGRKDGMHLEIVASEAACAAALARNSGRPSGGGSPSPAPTPTPAPAQTSKVEPMFFERPLVKGENYLRIPCMVGSASALFGRAWVSITGEGGGSMQVNFQKNAPTDGPPPGAGEQWGPTVFRNASRVGKEIPSGTEYLEVWITLKGRGGAVAIEMQPK